MKSKLPFKTIGLAVSVIGSILAVLFIPCKIIGVGTGWHFILGNAGLGVKYYKLLDTKLLLIELIVINVIGAGLYFFGKK